MVLALAISAVAFIACGNDNGNGNGTGNGTNQNGNGGNGAGNGTTTPAAIESGAYMLTEENLREFLYLMGESEEEINEAVEEYFEEYQQMFWAIVYNNHLSFSYWGLLVLNNQPLVKQNNNNIFSFETIIDGDNGLIGITYSSGVLSVEVDFAEWDEFFVFNLELNTAVEFSTAAARQLSAIEQEDFSGTSSSIWWDLNEETYAGIVGFKREFRAAGQAEFIALEFDPVRSSITLNEVDMAVGDNTIRVTVLGGRYIYFGEEAIVINQTINSEPTTFTIPVTAIDTHTLTAPTNFEIAENSTHVSWTNGANVSNNRVYLNNELITSGSSISFAWNWINWVVGNNVLRVVPQTSQSLNLATGVLTRNVGDVYGTFTINVTSIVTAAAAPYIAILGNHSFIVEGVGNLSGWNQYFYMRKQGSEEFLFVNNASWGNGQLPFNNAGLTEGTHRIRVDLRPSGGQMIIATLIGGVLTTTTLTTSSIYTDIIVNAQGEVSLLAIA